MEKVLDYIIHLQSPMNSFVEQRTYFTCTPIAKKYIAYQALDVVNVNHTFIVSLVHEKKVLLKFRCACSGFNWLRVLFVTEEAAQAYDFVYEYQTKLGYITNIQKHISQIERGRIKDENI